MRLALSPLLIAICTPPAAARGREVRIGADLRLEARGARR